jgi:hypothetical protein
MTKAMIRVILKHSPKNQSHTSIQTKTSTQVQILLMKTITTNL